MVPDPNFSFGIINGDGSLDLCLSSGVGLNFLSGVLALICSTSISWKSLSSNLCEENNQKDIYKGLSYLMAMISLLMIISKSSLSE